MQAFFLGEKNYNANFQLIILAFLLTRKFQGRAIFLTDRSTVSLYMSFERGENELSKYFFVCAVAQLGPE